jgi:hypothetical protein
VRSGLVDAGIGSSDLAGREAGSSNVLAEGPKSRLLYISHCTPYSFDPSTFSLILNILPARIGVSGINVVGDRAQCIECKSVSNPITAAI